MRKVRKAVIPCAGLGTRMLPWTKVVPKELFPISNKPAIHYVVEEAVASGVEEIILVCNPKKPPIVDYFRPAPDLIAHLEAKGKKKEADELRRLESLAKFTVVYQEEALGLGHAVLCARKAVGDEPFFVILPDVLISGEETGCEQLIDGCGRESGELGWGLLLERVSRDRMEAYGIVSVIEMGQEGRYRVVGAVEKPKAHEAPSDLSILGRYLFKPAIFDLLGGAQGKALREIQLTDAIDRLARTTPGQGILIRGKNFDIGTDQGFLEACKNF